jgi:hypothetical protein
MPTPIGQFISYSYKAQGRQAARLAAPISGASEKVDHLSLRTGMLSFSLAAGSNWMLPLFISRPSALDAFALSSSSGVRSDESSNI